MSNLTKCKDCGHQVSKRAKACPGCGAENPGNRTSAFTYFISFIVMIWLWGIVITEWATMQQGFTATSNQVETPTAISARVFTDAQIQSAISKSDDYKIHRAAFEKAANFLLTKNRCTQQELKEYGGFVKAQGGYKNQPIYFTYCGGVKTSNRFYVDADTGLVSQ